MTENEALLYLAHCKGIGPIHAKNILKTYTLPQNIFRATGIELHQLCGLNDEQIHQIKNATKNHHISVAQALKFLEKNQIELLPFYRDAYPIRLRQIVDAPFLLYVKGNVSLNPSRTIAIVGTRKPTAHSVYLTQKFIEQSKVYGVQIISGLAYGIDICAHRSSLQHQISNLGVLAHGLDQIYPTAHYETAQQMLNNGALISEMPLFTKLHPDLFPRRNRIIAGMSDAVLVVESQIIGGSMSTAQIARSCDRDVFAIPGNPAQGHNSGCNALIKRQVAALVEDFEDIVTAMNWKNKDQKETFRQTELFLSLTEDEKTILQTLTGKQLHIDELIQHSGIPLHRLTLSILELELRGVIKVLPGKYYQRIS